MCNSLFCVMSHFWNDYLLYKYLNHGRDSSVFALSSFTRNGLGGDWGTDEKWIWRRLRCHAESTLTLPGIKMPFPWGPRSGWKSCIQRWIRNLPSPLIEPMVSIEMGQKRRERRQVIWAIYTYIITVFNFIHLNYGYRLQSLCLSNCLHSCHLYCGTYPTTTVPVIWKHCELFIAIHRHRGFTLERVCIAREVAKMAPSHVAARSRGSHADIRFAGAKQIRSVTSHSLFYSLSPLTPSLLPFLSLSLSGLAAAAALRPPELMTPTPSKHVRSSYRVNSISRHAAPSSNNGSTLI